MIESLLNSASTLSINMLVTKDMYPLPPSVIISKNIGQDNLMLTNHEGEVVEVVTGDHMILEMDSLDMLRWVANKRFWLFDSEAGEYNQVLIQD